jgi:APA family basic amino acid/polyamine antiporter
MSSQKIGFWAVFALVTGSQIGSGVFMLPAALAPFGGLSLWGWVASGFGAIALALVFGQLCARIPKTGGPHAYVAASFGDQAGFFTGWTYWVISWISTTAVIVASVGYLTPLIGTHSKFVQIGLEIGLLALITLLNLRGVKASGNAEFVLTLMKIVPLLVLPIAALFLFEEKNFVKDISVEMLSDSTIIGKVTLMTLWGFVGVESATAPAGSVENPSKTIPRAIIAGTICVALLYFLNSLGIMGVVPGQDLMNSKAPYGDAARIVFGGNWHFGITLLAAIICIGTLNAWVLTSGQITLGLAQDKFLPKIFTKRNRYGAPFVGILISSMGIVPLLVLTASDNLAKQIAHIIDFSVTAFLFVYAISCLSFLKLLLKEKSQKNIWEWIYGLVAFGFCLWIFYKTELMTLLIAGSFVISGIPMYFFMRKNKPADHSGDNSERDMVAD